jgi:hypothetical protein
MAAARLEKEKEKEGSAATAASPDKEIAANNAESSGGAPPVIIRQRSMTPRSKRENNHRLSYIDNEIRFLDAEQQEIDRQAAILDKRLRYRVHFPSAWHYLSVYFVTRTVPGSGKAVPVPMSFQRFIMYIVRYTVIYYLVTGIHLIV